MGVTRIPIKYGLFLQSKPAYVNGMRQKGQEEYFEEQSSKIIWSKSQIRLFKTGKALSYDIIFWIVAAGASIL